MTIHSWQPPVLYAGVFLAQDGRAVARIDGIQLGPEGLRFTLVLWPGTPKRTPVGFEPWSREPGSALGVLSVVADGVTYASLDAEQQLLEEDGRVTPYLVPSHKQAQRAHLWLSGFGSLDSDGSVTCWPVLRGAIDGQSDKRAAPAHLEVRLSIDELGVDLHWDIELGEPLYSPPPTGPGDAGAPAATAFPRPALFRADVVAQSDLAVGRLDSFSLSDGTLRFRQSIWAQQDTLGHLFMHDLWFERENAPVGTFNVTIDGTTHIGRNGRSELSALTMTNASMARDSLSVDWELELPDLGAVRLRGPVRLEMTDPVTRVELTWEVALDDSQSTEWRWLD